MTRKLATVTEEFAMTVGLGDDFIMRLSIQGFEDLRTHLFHVLQSCRLPKVSRMVSNLLENSGTLEFLEKSRQMQDFCCCWNFRDLCYTH